jgi:hypothetical protein
LIGMQADLLACAACGIRNLLFVTGDPPKLGDYPHATGVFDADSIGMAAVQRRLNGGVDLGGHLMAEPGVFRVGRGDVLTGDDAADALHVGPDEDLHSAHPEMATIARKQWKAVM